MSSDHHSPLLQRIVPCTRLRCKGYYVISGSSEGIGSNGKQLVPGQGASILLPGIPHPDNPRLATSRLFINHSRTSGVVLWSYHANLAGRSTSHLDREVEDGEEEREDGEVEDGEEEREDGEVEYGEEEREDGEVEDEEEEREDGEVEDGEEEREDGEVEDGEREDGEVDDGEEEREDGEVEDGEEER